VDLRLYRQHGGKDPDSAVREGTDWDVPSEADKPTISASIHILNKLGSMSPDSIRVPKEGQSRESTDSVQVAGASSISREFAEFQFGLQNSQKKGGQIMAALFLV
jgi:hypothetical protein